MSRYNRWQLFRKKNGQIAYNTTCLRCAHSCKQSWRTKLMECRRFAHK